MINVEIFQVGFLGTNCYIVTDESTNRRAIVDPGYKSPALVNRIKELGADTFDYILLTHGHFDHIWYTEEIRNLTSAKVVISKGDAPFLSDGNLNLSSSFSIRNFPSITADVVLENNSKIFLGNTELTMLSTPGHTIGSSCFISFADKVVFSGDTLFRLSMGRTDFVTGDPAELLSSLNKLLSLKGDFMIYPGHNETTTLEYERKNNPYVSEK